MKKVKQHFSLMDNPLYKEEIEKVMIEKNRGQINIHLRNWINNRISVEIKKEPLISLDLRFFFKIRS
jgi:hypothetical protein